MFGLLVMAAFLAAIQPVHSRCECMEKIILLNDEDDIFRLVKTPDYPRNYCPGLNCTWRVVSSGNDSKIYFYADKIDLRDSKDFIEFYEQTFLKIPENASHICTGSGHSCSFSTTNKIMTIRFVSGFGDVDNVGFNGVVSGYDKNFRELRNKFLRYASIPVVIVLVIAVFVAIYCCYKKRNLHNTEYTKAPTRDRANLDSLE